MNTCQIIFLSVIIAASAEETPRWTGPFADHKLGHLVQDTPEVAAAKMHHALAHTQIRAILPELPPEDTAEEEPNVVPQPRPVVPVPQVHPQVVPQVPQPRPVDVPQVRVVPQQLAEEVPRSPLGEVPEVEAARKAHLAAILEAVALNQKLGGDEPSTFRPHVLGRRAGLFPLRH
ncbi:hypothetical protein TcasGA2_TC008250 [Tribolium castaneum]|uniref:Uncharacterized protein n=1 Tax=Tribolium castaneum TaxID=7070 RepID=D2A0P8_TRICA|nr:PREDICTED: uncharacterized protein LOC103312797 [Tribolium castaneum]EFA02545.1 hypothetical protein TcasGA2_TC008250 [Tribolium castaneum]|eukprot:XP_008192536.1 PREDICTED: uncharacterized protein LOC103312797 [Tribolium castaneum]